MARLIRESGSAGVEFLWNEAKKADTTRLRAILLALTQPPFWLSGNRTYDNKGDLRDAHARLLSIAVQKSFFPKKSSLFVILSFAMNL